MVNTVLGPMETSEMGRTLMHEHAVCFDMALKKAFGKKWVDEDAAIELIVKELKAAKEYSGIVIFVKKFMLLLKKMVKKNLRVDITIRLKKDIHILMMKTAP